MADVQFRVRARAAHRALRVVFTHPSNQGVVARQLASLCRFEFNAARGRPTVVPFAGHSRVSASKGGNSSSRAAFARLPDWPEMRVWQEWLGEGDVFVDVGANVGLYSIVAAELGCHVIAVEPAPDMASLLRSNVVLNGLDLIEVREVALMAHAGFVHLAGADPNRRSAKPAVGRDQESLPALTLDDLLGSAPIAGLKIDVEGNERLVLQGADNLLSDGRVKLVQLEWNSTCEVALGEGRSSVASLLTDQGFTLFRAAKGRFTRYPNGDVPGYGADVFAAVGDAAEFLASFRT